MVGANRIIPFTEGINLFLFFLARPKEVKSYPKGRLLTPEEGCGYSKVQNKRIVGGAPAKNGAWPWYERLCSLCFRIPKEAI